jgi:CheY-like chemotaxis protein
LLEQLRAAGAMPAVIISDWRLTQGDGLEAIAAIRAQARATVPALLISGEFLPQPLQDLGGMHITTARKPLAALALRAWLSSPAAGISAADHAT